MDPNTTLAEIRRLTDSALNAWDTDPHKRNANLQRLAELTQALDEWIASGGFLPRDWSRDS